VGGGVEGAGASRTRARQGFVYEENFTFT